MRDDACAPLKRSAHRIEKKHHECELTPTRASWTIDVFVAAVARFLSTHPSTVNVAEARAHAQGSFGSKPCSAHPDHRT